MYYPKITRRTSYKTSNRGTYYSNYSEYHDEISEDCQHRCVYCDILLKENGGEGMHLDHFRPQKHFPNLSNSPLNLLLACAKCNQLKSDFWPDEKLSKSHFIDPFSIIRSNHFSVKNTGEVEGLSSQSQYTIELLSINRPSRRTIRKTRAVKQSAMEVIEHIELELEKLANGSIPDAVSRLPPLCTALSEVRHILNSL